MMYFIAFSFGYMATFVSSDISRNISVQMSLFFNGLWPFVIKMISAFKRSKKCVDGQCTQQIKFTTIPGLRRSKPCFKFYISKCDFTRRNLTDNAKK